MQPERKGKYALVGLTATGFDWWMINDLEKMYAVVTVQASFPDAEKVIRNAWDALESIRRFPSLRKQANGPVTKFEREFFV